MLNDDEVEEAKDLLTMNYVDGTCLWPAGMRRLDRLMERANEAQIREITLRTTLRRHREYMTSAPACGRSSRAVAGVGSTGNEKVLPGQSTAGDGAPEENLALAVPTKYPGTRYPGVSGAVRG